MASRSETSRKAILEATSELLADTSVQKLSIEAIAKRAGVGKTTIYRRWPTKTDLARAALHTVADSIQSHVDTGDLRSDLLALLGQFRDLLSSTRGRSLLRMLLAEGADPEVAELARSVRESKECESRLVIARGIRRGELPKGSDPDIILQTVSGALQNLALFHCEDVSDRRLAQIVDLVLVGAKAGGALKLRRA
jgi:AcrR family transcriptional regulator